VYYERACKTMQKIGAKFLSIFCRSYCDVMTSSAILDQLSAV